MIPMIRSLVRRRRRGWMKQLSWLLLFVVITGVGSSADHQGKLKTDKRDGGSVNVKVPETNNAGGPAVPPQVPPLPSPSKIDKTPPQQNLPSSSPPPPPSPSTELTTDPLNNLLIISTLDGTLTAMDRFSGEVLWVSKDTKPMIQVPLQQNHQKFAHQQNEDQQHQRLPKAPYFLPDPKTGSLYMMGKQNSLRKLPFTIPQLVSMAPCKNSEGLMYTGRKLDSWVMLNPYTGEKTELPMDMGQEETCPANPTSGYCSDQPEKTRYANPKSILIGKTEYSLAMMDGGRKWNVTYQLYSSLDMTPQSVQDYDLVHFTSPSEGHVLTYDRSSGQLLWQSTLPSPMIGLYSLQGPSANLVSVPFNPTASDTLERLRDGGDSSASSQKALNPTTYVGECAYGLYAVPTLADEKVLVIGDASKLPPLLAGPGGSKGEQPGRGSGQEQNDEYLLLGYYQTEGSGAQVQQSQQIESGAGPVVAEPNSNSNTIPVQYNDSEFIDDGINGKVVTFDMGGSTHSQSVKQPIYQQPERTPVQFPPPMPIEPKKKIPKEVKIVFTTAIISIAITSLVLGLLFVSYRRYKNNQFQKLLSSSDSGGVLIGGGSGGSGERLSGSRLVAAMLPDGSQDMTIGKITFNPSKLLGKGCEGTFVFRGTFEGRDVAVKRILPECFAFADREVDLLKESDQHQNVIRYFCTETDGQFRYIALELCAATLSDWVEGKYKNPGIDEVEVLREATEGLAYLHSLRIVHRDVKPANVLLCEGGGGWRVRTVISDFGLCKKIQSGRMSYSRRSGGMPGTDGWIAPEVVGDGGFNGSGSGGGRMTYAVDIFSMGCVFYYVLSKGYHPFGNVFNRQSNILSGDYDLSKISTDLKGTLELIKALISMDPEERPPLRAVLKHPMFWSNEKVLSFFLDVSDRIEKESEEGFPLLRRFEEGGGVVVKGDWRDHICSYVAMDLRKYRTYKGGSVRDLLRALRNKKNHYRELEKEAQTSLGEIPDAFAQYWVTRFPSLLPYTWGMFEGLKREGVFSRYYDADFDFFGEYGEGEVYSGEGDDNSGNDTFKEKQVSLGKDFWKSKNQAKYQKWRRGGGGNNGGNRGSPKRFENSNRRDNGDEPDNNELSASTDNYWRARDGHSKSPVIRRRADENNVKVES